jgi:hypothetical protein
MNNFGDLPHPNMADIGGIVMNTENGNGIPIITIAGEIQSGQQLKDIYSRLLEKYGILDTPDQYLIRNVRKSMVHEVVEKGCERNESSYRDRVLEMDFCLGPNDYTYCNGYDGDRNEYLRHAIYNPKGTALVIYRSNKMVPRHEEKYDKASSLGQGSTKVTYEFLDKNHKKEAVFLIVQADFKDLDDLIWQ